jgi:hypothetical protein
MNRRQRELTALESHLSLNNASKSLSVITSSCSSLFKVPFVLTMLKSGVIR